jgi:hypothetical protein
MAEAGYRCDGSGAKYQLLVKEGAEVCGAKMSECQPLRPSPVADWVRCCWLVERPKRKLGW